MPSRLETSLAGLPSSPSLTDIQKALKTHESDLDEDKRRDLTWLLCSIFSVTRSQLLAESQISLKESDLKRFLPAVTRLLSGEPLAFILGSQEFLGRQFKVSKDVLIPRPETESLVIAVQDAIAKHPEWRTGLDIGTGSGCIAVSLALSAPQMAWHGWDVSRNALAVARNNASLLAAPVKFEERDILAGPPWNGPKELDVVVSNPPYIALEEMESLSPSVTEFEPHLALFAPGNDPLCFYDKIGAWAYEKLSDTGEIFFEIHHRFADGVVKTLSKYGFKNARVIKDLSGKDRIVTATKR
jgi:release factor glutamine methyltransferase